MKNTIVRTFMGTHMDLSKIVSISDARFIDRMGSGGFFAGFDIHIQLLDKPVHYEVKFDNNDEADYNTYHRPVPIMGRSGVPLAVERLQKQVDGLIQQWKDIQ